MSSLQDYVFFIPPPPFYTEKRSTFAPSIEDCWYGRVALVFKVHVRTDADAVMACTCAMIETLWDYCPQYSKQWWKSTAQIGSKMLYLPKPAKFVWIVPISSILGRLPLVPAGETGTIPRSMHARQQACFEYGECDRAGEPGTGSLLFHVNSWAMVFPSDHPVLHQ
jgi:hypothetical protein